MKKVIVLEHISLDGVIQAPGGPDEDKSGGQIMRTHGRGSTPKGVIVANYEHSGVIRSGS